MKKLLPGPACRKCDGVGHYCVELPLQGEPPDNRRHCEICGGKGYEPVKKNPIEVDPRQITSTKRDEYIHLLREIVQEHIRRGFQSNDPVRILIEQSLQRMILK